MANGITNLARRMGIYEALQPEIRQWAAQKHYFNRMRMLFAPSKEVSRSERKRLYKRMISDPVYREAASEGIRLLPRTTTRWIGCHADHFLSGISFTRSY